MYSPLFNSQKKRARLASVQVRIPGDSDGKDKGPSIYVTSIHLGEILVLIFVACLSVSILYDDIVSPLVSPLDHRTEPTRLIEIEAIKNFLDPVFASNSPQIWTGDFNALTREDYPGW